MPLSYATFTGNSGSPQHTFTIPFNYILKDHIKVYYGRDILANTQTALLVSGTDYNFTSDTTIQLIGSTINSGTATGNPHNLANGVVLTLERDTPDSSQIVEFADGSNLIGDNLNNANLQNLFVVQEQQDKNDLSAAKSISAETASTTATNNVATLSATQFRSDGSQAMTGDLNAGNNKVKNVSDPTNAQDAVTKAYLERTGSIQSAQILDGTIVDADINASANIAGSKVQAASGSNPGTLSASDKSKLDGIESSAKDDQTGAEIKSLYEGESDTNAFTDAEKTKLSNIESSAKDDQTGSEIKSLYESQSDTNAFTDAEKTKLASINASFIKTQYESNANTNPLTDAEKAVIDGVTANTSELNKLDGFTGDVNDLNQISGMDKQTTITNSDAHFPTSGAVVDFVANQIAPVGGLEVIADEDSFPATQPVSGVVISISNADGLIINNAGEASNARTVGSGSDNVTIKNFPASLRNKTLAPNLGLLVSSTGAAQEYNYHKLLAKEEDVLQLSDDINDFNARYRVVSSNPTSNNDAGDLIFNTSTQKLLVYNSVSGAFEEAQSVGNFFISTLSPAFNGSVQDFTITNAPSNAQQIILSINGVIQKPNSGTSTPSEGFALSGSTVKLAAAPASGSDYFAIVLGSTVNIGTPSNNTVTSAMIVDGSIVNGDISNSADIAGSKLSLVSTSSTAGIIVKGDGSSDGYLQLNCSQNSHGIKLKSPPHSAGQSYTLTFPSAVVNGAFLKTDSNGNLSFEAVDLTALSASNLTSGTIPDARFPSVLPAIDGSNLTGISSVGGATGVDFNDNVKARFGTGNDFEIFHDPNENIIKSTGTSDFKIKTDTTINITKNSSEDIAKFIPDGAVELYHNNVKKFETAADRVNVYGHVFIRAGDSLYLRNGFDNANARIRNTESSGESNMLFTTNNGSGETDKWELTKNGHFIPQANNSYDIGATSYRVRNIYTNDLNLSNEGSSNDVDGTWGSFTIQEGAEDLFLVNKRNGKKYKFNLTEVS